MCYGTKSALLLRILCSVLWNVVCPVLLFLLATVLPVLLLTDSDYHFDIFKLTATNVDITKILLKVAINTITPQTLPIINRKHTHTYVCVCVCVCVCVITFMYAVIYIFHLNNR